MSDRPAEIGIRMALGVQRCNVLSAIVRQGMTLTSIGYGLGVVLAATLIRVVSSPLYGVTPTDPLMFALTILVPGAVAFASCWPPGGSTRWWH